MTSHTLDPVRPHPPLRARSGGSAMAFVVLGWIGVIGLVVVAIATPVVVAGAWLVDAVMNR